MFKYFCSIEQLCEVLDSNPEIKGYSLRMSMRDTYEILIWVDTEDKIDSVFDYIKEKTEDLEHVPNMHFIEMRRVEFVLDEELEGRDLEDFKDELRQRSREPERTVYPHLNSWVNNKTKKFGITTPLATFYSYKGGVGRSTALAIAARLLGTKLSKNLKNKKIVILDFDVEAPGQYILFKGDKEPTYGLIDYLKHQLYIDRQLTHKELEDYYTSTWCEYKNEKGEKVEGGEIYLFNAFGVEGRENYLKNIAYVDFDMFVRTNKNYVETLLKNIEEVLEPDIILVDGRTGFSDVSGMFLNASDLVNVFVGISEQNEFGIRTILEQYKENNKDATLYMPNYNFYFSILPEEENREDELRKEERLKLRLYKIMEDVFGERFFEPDFGEALLLPKFIYRQKKLEQSDYKTLDEFVENENEEPTSLIDEEKSIFNSRLMGEHVSDNYIIDKIIRSFPAYQALGAKLARLFMWKNEMKTLKRLNKEEIRQQITKLRTEIDLNIQRWEKEDRVISSLAMLLGKDMLQESDVLFGERLNESNFNSSKVIEWFNIYLSNSRGNSFPRDIYIFIDEIIKDYEQNVDQYFESDTARVFPPHKLFRKKNYYATAKRIYEELCKDEELKKYVEGFKQIDKIEFPISEDTLNRYIGTELDLKSREADEYIAKLAEAGIIHKRDNEYIMSPLYLNVFGKRRKTPLV